MEKESKRFEDWVEVDCNECARWWDSSCDGIPPNRSRMPCNSFLATRGVIIPQQIKALKKSIKRIKVAYILLAVALLIHVGVRLFV